MISTTDASAMRTTPVTHLFYHSGDLDGHCSGAVLIRYCEAHNYPYILHPFNYGDQFPWDEIRPFDSVMMADLSLQPYENMEHLHRNCKRFIWLDHHISAIQAVTERGLFLPGVQKDGIAGCECAWKYCFPNETMPWFVELLGRYDVFDNGECDADALLSASKRQRWAEYILPFQYWMRCQSPTDPSCEGHIWNVLFDGELDGHTNRTTIFEQGRLLVKYERTTLSSYLRSCAYRTEFDGYTAIVCNRLGGSMLFEDADTNVDMYLSYVDLGQAYRVSIFTPKEDFDCSIIAKRYQGGGHRKAAGFICTTLPWKAAQQ